jgi:hypothetical protein
MSKLVQRQSLIQEKRKNTPWREFVMEICSWFPLMFYKNNGKIGRYFPNNRITNTIVEFSQYYQEAASNIQDDMLPQ